MYTKFQKLNEGFTIVETLIVLAIAALIITIILIAVPDLQRSSRNSNILHDAQNVAHAVGDFEGNNQGSLPDTIAIANGTVTISSAANGGATATAKVQTKDTVSSTAVGTVVKAAQVPLGNIDVVFAADCSANGSGSASAAGGTGLTPTADSRAVAVYYPIEISGAGGPNVGCIQQ